MDPNKALKLLDDLCAKITLSRKEHQLVCDALACLNDIVRKESSDGKASKDD